MPRRRFVLSLFLVRTGADEKQLALTFLGRFEQEFVNQGMGENRSVFDSLDLAWSLLRTFPREQLNRIPKSASSFLCRRGELMVGLQRCWTSFIRGRGGSPRGRTRLS